MNPKFESLMKDLTDKFIKEIESGNMKWSEMWQRGLPANAESKREYNGFNAVYLGWLTKHKEWQFPYFVTFEQAKKLGGNVKKGEKSAIVTHWKFLSQKDDEGNLIPEGKVVPVVRFYNVFNIEQCEGLDHFGLELNKEIKLDIKSANQIIQNYKNRPQIVNKEDERAYYSPMNDIVNMPKKERFNNSESFYQVLFHELVHSTGHHTRLNRFETNRSAPFGSTEYSKEELVAELGASFLAHQVGIQEDTFKNSAAYLKGWAKEFKDKPTLLYTAANKAMNAVNHILGIDKSHNS